MAAIETLKKLSTVIKLENGSTSSGAVKTVNVSIGTLDKSSYDVNKIFNIVSALEAVFDKEISTVQTDKQYQLREE